MRRSGTWYGASLLVGLALAVAGGGCHLIFPFGVAHTSCRRVGLNSASTQGYWMAVGAYVKLSGAVCCVP